MRKTLAYDQGKEMSEHKRLTVRTGVAVFFADPHSPWQRGSCRGRSETGANVTT
jgi:IS30 family transposase